MIECNCKDPDVEYTVAKDEASGWILMEARCCNCGRSATGYGKTIEHVYAEVEKEWKRKNRRRQRR